MHGGQRTLLRHWSVETLIGLLRQSCFTCLNQTKSPQHNSPRNKTMTMNRRGEEVYYVIMLLMCALGIIWCCLWLISDSNSPSNLYLFHPLIYDLHLFLSSKICRDPIFIFFHLPKYAGAPSLSFSIFWFLAAPHLYLFSSFDIWPCTIFIFQRYLFSNPAKEGPQHSHPSNYKFV